MNETYDLRIGESHIEVHKFRGGAIVLATVVALFLQASVPVYFPKFSVLDLPLLLTIYFGLSRRNPSTGLLLGMTIGLLQDSLSGPTVPFGPVRNRENDYRVSRVVDRRAAGYRASPGAVCADDGFLLRAPGSDSGDAADSAGAAGTSVHAAAGHRRGRERHRRRFLLHVAGPPAEERKASPRWSGYLACKELTSTSNSGRARRFSRHESFRKNGQQANPVLTLRSSHSKAAARRLQDGEDARNLVVGVMGVAEGFRDGARASHTFECRFRLSAQRMIQT